MGLFDRLVAPKATVSVNLDKNEFSLKEPVTGVIQISSSDEFDADEIRLEFEVREFTKATQTIGSGKDARPVTAQESSIVYNGKITVAGRTHLVKGITKDFPFSINLPRTVPPTYRGRNAKNTWMMKGVIAISGRPDVTSHVFEVQINS